VQYKNPDLCSSFDFLARETVVVEMIEATGDVAATYKLAPDVSLDAFIAL
jgi:hypothetical protein